MQSNHSHSHSHSQPYPHYIACAMLVGCSAQENQQRLAQARAIADTLGVPYRPVKGAYKGEPETSLELYGPSAESCARILAITFAQETYLEVSDSQTVTFILPELWANFLMQGEIEELNPSSHLKPHEIKNILAWLKDAELRIEDVVEYAPWGFTWDNDANDLPGECVKVTFNTSRLAE